MNTFAKFSLVTAIIASALATQAGGVSGYVRSNGTYVAPYVRSTISSGSVDCASGAAAGSGYVYRNPYAAHPSVSVHEYTRENGTIVHPYQRTPANDTPTDNLNYRGFGTVREPRDLNVLR